MCSAGHYRAVEALDRMKAAAQEMNPATTEVLKPCRRHSRSSSSSLAGEVLASDPMLESVYRAGLLTVKDLRSLAACLHSREVDAILRDQARGTVARAALTLRALRACSEAMAAHVRSAVWAAERRWAQLEVPLSLIHPSLDAPLRPCRAPVAAAMYDDVPTQALLCITHPSAWAPATPGAGLWDHLAAAGGLSLRPCLALLLAEVIPVEARLCYLRLGHAAHAARGAGTLAEMAAAILARMMTQPYGPADAERAAKRLGSVAAVLHPFTLFLLRALRAGRQATDEQLAQQREEVSLSIAALLEAHGDAALYDSAPWRRWLLQLDTPALLSCYLTYLCEGFQ